MTTRRQGRACAFFVVALAVGVACEPIVEDPGPAAPINACPAHPCDTFTQPGPAPSCNAGACTVVAPTTNLLLVIGLATDSYLAPGRTYLATLNGGPLASGACALPNCSPPVCALPEWTQDQSAYLMDLNAASPRWANWYLGNRTGVTSLPVQATFRRLFGSPPQDSLDLGLPVDPIQAVNVIPTGGGNPGPNGTPGLQFRTYLPPVPPGCYERTLQPLSPFSKAFPPEIKPWPPDQTDSVDVFDTTREEMLPNVGAATAPTFDLRRAEGLEGWTAYLRNIHTRRVFSNVVPLTGSLMQGVKLLTNHATPVPSSQPFEALTDLELVMAPPAGTPLPTEVFAPAGTPPAQEIAALQEYPSLPTPVTVSGRIRTPAGTPVPADVYFTATDITKQSGERFPPNFEFSTRVSAITDPRTGASTYSALLPQGIYQIAVRPTDGSNAVTIATRTVGGEGNVMTGEDMDVVPLVAVSGTATVADGRPLAEAVVEVLPTQCAPIAATVDASTPPSDACLPRAAQTLTSAKGLFTLSVDPGQYLLRIRPRDGSRWPWKIQPISVAATAVDVGAVVIPAPISVGMQLTDSASPAVPSKNNRLVNAIVRVYTDPSQGAPAVELGEAITDSNGNYEMYLAPLTQ